MGKLRCYITAALLYIRSGVWSPHIYEEVSKEQKIVIATNHGFRISDNLIHAEWETVHPKALVIKSKCRCCGHEDLSWYDREPVIIKT